MPINQYIASSLKSIDSFNEVTALRGIIKNLYPEELKADVYLPDIGQTQYKVRLVFPGASRITNDIVMPVEESECLLMILSKGHTPIAIPNIYTQNLENQNKEIIYPGEFNFNSSGFSGIKADKDGNLFVFDGAGGVYSKNSRGRSEDFAIGKAEKTITGLSKIGIDLDDINAGLAGNYEFGVSGVSEFFSQIELKTTMFTKAQLILPEDEHKLVEIDAAKKDTVLKDTVKYLNLSSDKFSAFGITGIISKLQNLYKNPISIENINQAISTVENLFNDYILNKSGVKLKLRYGAVSRTSGITRGEDRILSYAQSPVCFDFEIVNPLDDYLLAGITIDEDGHYEIKGREIRFDANQTAFANAVKKSVFGSELIISDMQEKTDLVFLSIEGKTTEEGTGEKSPDNPFTITGVADSGLIYIFSTGDFTTEVPVSLNSPMYHLNEVKDIAEVTNGKVIRATGSLLLDGSEDWVLADNNASQVNTAAFLHSFSEISTEAINNCISDRFQNTMDVSLDNEYIKSNTEAPGIMIRISKSRMPQWSDSLESSEKIALFKAWLLSNNTKVIYRRENPVSESIAPQRLDLYYPNTRINSNDDAEPILNVTYLQDLNSVIEELRAAIAAAKGV